MAVIVPPLDRPRADLSQLFRPYTARPIRVRLDPAGAESCNGAEIRRARGVLGGFARLAASGAAPASIALIGAGSVLEAIGAGHIFRSLERILVTDSDPARRAAAEQAIAGNIDRPIPVEALAGTLPAPLAAARRRVDLIYADLADRFPVSEDVVDGARSGQKVEGAALADAPALTTGGVGRHPLAPLSRFLAAVPGALAPGGMALVRLAGTLPYALLAELADTAGIRLEPIGNGLEALGSSDRLLAAHAAAEADGAEFDFYDLERARWAVREGEDLSGSALELALAPWRRSAGRALGEARAGIAIGRLWHLVLGVPKPSRMAG